MKVHREFNYVILLISICCGCRNSGKAIEGDKILAKAGDNVLYLSDFNKEGNIYFNSGKDSIAALYAYAENWCRDQVFQIEARNRIGNSNEINELVESYRSSLYSDALEKIILKESHDTSVTENELIQYYQENRNEYKLDGPILKLRYAIFKKNSVDEKTFVKLWNSDEMNGSALLQKYCSDHAEDYKLNGDRWIKWNDVKESFPKSIININKLTKKTQQVVRTKDLYYYIRIFDLVRPNEELSLSFVREQAIKSILYLKKFKQLENKKKQLYEKAFKDKSINILVK